MQRKDSILAEMEALAEEVCVVHGRALLLTFQPSLALSRPAWQSRLFGSDKSHRNRFWKQLNLDVSTHPFLFLAVSRANVEILSRCV